MAITRFSRDKCDDPTPALWSEPIYVFFFISSVSFGYADHRFSRFFSTKLKKPSNNRSKWSKKNVSALKIWEPGKTVFLCWSRVEFVGFTVVRSTAPVPRRFQAPGTTHGSPVCQKFHIKIAIIISTSGGLGFTSRSESWSTLRGCTSGSARVRRLAVYICC